MYKRLPNYSPVSNQEASSEHRDVVLGLVEVAAMECVRGAIVACAGLLSYLGKVEVDEELAAMLAIDVLPLSAALNPCVYIMSRVMADRTRHRKR
jgi:hypothetical protein